MPEDDVQSQMAEEIKKLFKKFDIGGEYGPIHDRQEWDQRVAVLPAQDAELVQELARLADLWKFFHERKQKLGGDVVSQIAHLHELPVPERIERLRKINLTLMERITDAGEDPRFRN